jgi:magnesium transporter
MENLQESCHTLLSDQVLHHVMDVVVEAYLSVLDHLEDDVEALNDLVVDRPGPCVLKQLGEVRSDLLEVRRILSAMRHVASQLRHSSNSLISRELHPFLGPVHDDLAIMLDTIAGERDRLAAVLDIYFSSLANRTTEATKTLTLLGTIVLPTLVITSIFGMNVCPVALALAAGDQSTGQYCCLGGDSRPGRRTGSVEPREDGKASGMQRSPR